MYDFSFCVPSSEKVNPAKNGTSRGPAVPLSENFFNELCWETTLFEFSSPKDIPQNSKQNNGSLVEEVWKHEGMGGIYELGHTKSHMRWESPKSAHTLRRCLIYLSHCITYTKTNESQIQSVSQAIWGQAQVQEYSTKQDIYYSLVFSGTHPGQGLVPSLPSSTQARDCNRSRL